MKEFKLEYHSLIAHYPRSFSSSHNIYTCLWDTKNFDAFEFVHMHKISIALYHDNYDEVAALLAETKKRKSFHMGIYQQFVQYAEVIISKEMTDNEALHILLQSISITIKNFNYAIIDTHRLTYSEIIIITEIAIRLYKVGMLKEAIELLENLKSNVDNYLLCNSHKAPIYPMLLYNLAFMYAQDERLDESEVIGHTAKQFCFDIDNVLLVPYIFNNMAFVRFRKGDINGIEEYLCKAYFMADTFRKYDYANAIQDDALNFYHLKVLTSEDNIHATIRKYASR